MDKNPRTINVQLDEKDALLLDAIKNEDNITKDTNAIRHILKLASEYKTSLQNRLQYSQERVKNENMTNANIAQGLGADIYLNDDGFFTWKSPKEGEKLLTKDERHLESMKQTNIELGKKEKNKIE